MINRNKALLSIIIFLTVIYGACNSSFFARVLRDHHPEFFYYHIASIVTKDKKGKMDQQEAIVEYIDHNVFAQLVDQEVYPVIDHPAMDVLLRGVGWCDQVSDLFIRLIEWKSIRAFDIFLYDFNKDGEKFSPHTVALVVPDGIGNEEYRSMMGAGGYSNITDNNESLEGRKVGGVVDALEGVVFRNRDNDPATLDDLCQNNILASQKKYLDLPYSNPQIYCNNPTVWLTNTPLSERPTGSIGLAQNIFPFLPQKAFHLIHDRILNLGYAKFYPSGFNSDSFIYLKARIYHVTERFDEAIELYDEILNKTTDFKTRAACQLFKGMIFVRKKEFANARVQLESIIESQPPSPWVGVAKKWAKKIKT